MRADPDRPTVVVITGATGNALLANAVKSVEKQQTKAEVQHWIVVDGESNKYAVEKILGKMPVPHPDHVRKKLLVLPENTGGTGYVCHRINGAVPWLCNSQYVCFLDEDNEFEPWHVQNLLDSVGEIGAWSHSFRTVIDARGEIICKDFCESLGGVCHTVMHPNDRLVDTNCYLLRRDVAIKLSPVWNVKARQHGQLEADRALCKALLEQYPMHGVSRSCSVRYRVDGRGDSVTGDFFKRGNAFFGRGVGGYDFETKKDVYLFHFDPHATAKYIHGDPAEKNPLAEWCMTMWKGFEREYNILDGFMNVEYIPDGATCLVTMCNPQTLPLDVFEKRKQGLDIILYTAEGPNARHAAQWTNDFLGRYFTKIATFWKPLLEAPPEGVRRVAKCPHNARFLEFPRDADVFRENTGCNKSICMVLERRGTRGAYTIDGTTLHSLDYLRESYLQGLRDVTVYGNNWTDFCRKHPEVKLGYSGPRMMDPNLSVDLLKMYEFALIIENCDAEGYVSEKIGDAFIAGSIPIYYGNPSRDTPLPEGTYIDLKKFRDGFELQAYLDSLTEEDVLGYKSAIVSKREKFLEERGCLGIYTAISSLMNAASRS